MEGYNNDVSMENNKTNNETATIVSRSSSSQKRVQEVQSEQRKKN